MAKSYSRRIGETIYDQDHGSSKTRKNKDMGATASKLRQVQCEDIKGLCVFDTPRRRAILTLILLVMMMLLTLMYAIQPSD